MLQQGTAGLSYQSTGELLLTTGGFTAVAQVGVLALTALTLLLLIDADFTRHVGEFVAVLLMSATGGLLIAAAQDLLVSPVTMAGTLREWLQIVPEKVMFGTDAYPYIPEMGWEESGWMAASRGRLALTIALTGMLRDGEITRTRALELARMVLRENARALYGLADVP